MNALDELREHLREAARRDIEAGRTRARRRHRRTVGLLVALLLGGAAAATAADLMAIGEPAPDVVTGSDRYRPAGERQILLQVENPDGGPTRYGVAGFTANNGDECVVAGVVRANSIGRVMDGTFRPYAANSPGNCRQADLIVGGETRVGKHMLVHGRTPDWVRYVIADGKRYRRDPSGAFLFVYAGERPTTGYDINFDPPTAPR